MDIRHPLYGFHHPIDIANGVQASTVWNTLIKVTVMCLNDSSFPIATLHKSRTQDKHEWALF